ncbi:MAG: RNase P modulator RnpM [Culicoidibacterales bacterium]
MKGKMPLRRCVVTREQLPKRELMRVVRNKEGIVSIDETGKAHGRGAYLQKSVEVVTLAKQRKVLERQFDIQIPEEIYQQLLVIAQTFEKEQ